MNRLWYVFVLALVLAVPVPAIAQAQAILKNRAESYAVTATANHKSASNKFDDAGFELAVSTVALKEIEKRYDKVKGDITSELEKAIIEQTFKTGKSVHDSQTKLLMGKTKDFPDGGPICKMIDGAKKCLDGGKKSYDIKEYSAAIGDYGACSSNALPAIRSLDKSLKDLKGVNALIESCDKILKKYEKKE